VLRPGGSRHVPFLLQDQALVSRNFIGGQR
jgi:hypothetical protein